MRPSECACLSSRASSGERGEEDIGWRVAHLVRPSAGAEDLEASSQQKGNSYEFPTKAIQNLRPYSGGFRPIWCGTSPTAYPPPLDSHSNATISVRHFYCSAFDLTGKENRLRVGS